MSAATTHEQGGDVGPLGQVFAKEIRRRRELRGLSQTDLALLLRERYGLKFHQATIDRVEKRTRPCRLDEVYAIAEVLGSSVDDMLDSWSTTERAWRQLAGIALRARESETRITLAIQQNLEALQGDRERILTGLAQQGEDQRDSQVSEWAREVLADLDRIWSWAAGFAKTSANTPAVPAWVSDGLEATHPATSADDRSA